MTTSPYMPNNDDERADLLEHLAATLPTYAALLEISAQDFDLYDQPKQPSLPPT